MYRLWNNFNSHPGKKYHTDGVRFDSRFPLIFAMLCRDIRMKYLPDGKVHPDLPYTYKEMALRYYSAIYNAYINVGGILFNLSGNLSGHVNTSTDNSLCNLFGLMLHAVRNHLSYEEFWQNQYLIMGDDMAFSDQLGLFSPKQLEVTYNSVNMFLESPCDKPAELEEIMFCGCSPKWRTVNGSQYLLYCYRKDKLLASYNYVKKGATVNQRAQKLVAITSLLFPDETTYNELKKDTYAYFGAHESELTEESKDLLSALDDLYLLKLFTGYESTAKSKFDFFLSLIGQECSAF